KDDKKDEKKDDPLEPLGKEFEALVKPKEPKDKEGKEGKEAPLPFAQVVLAALNVAAEDTKLQPIKLTFLSRQLRRLQSDLAGGSKLDGLLEAQRRARDGFRKVNDDCRLLEKAYAALDRALADLPGYAPYLEARIALWDGRAESEGRAEDAWFKAIDEAAEL